MIKSVFLPVDPKLVRTSKAPAPVKRLMYLTRFTEDEARDQILTALSAYTAQYVSMQNSDGWLAGKWEFLGWTRTEAGKAIQWAISGYVK